VRRDVMREVILPVMRPFTSQVCDRWITPLRLEKNAAQTHGLPLKDRTPSLHPAHGPVRRTRSRVESSTRPQKRSGSTTTQSVQEPDLAFNTEMARIATSTDADPKHGLARI
jgi:hypothetical protein